MLRIVAPSLFHAFESLSRIHAVSILEPLLHLERENVSKGKAHDVVPIRRQLLQLREQCELLELDSAIDKIDGILRNLKKQLRDRLMFARELGEVVSRIEGQLARRFMFFVPSQSSKYLDQSKELFGAKVERSFPSVIAEIEEAGQCLGLGRAKASVFHLMLIVETALKVLSRKTLKQMFSPGQEWWSYIDQIKNFIKVEEQKPRNRRSKAQWNKKKAFLNETIGALDAVRRAWRNPTMHVDRDYHVTETQAEHIFASVCQFMQKLSEKLHE